MDESDEFYHFKRENKNKRFPIKDIKKRLLLKLLYCPYCGDDLAGEHEKHLSKATYNSGNNSDLFFDIEAGIKYEYDNDCYDFLNRYKVLIENS